jgi:small nuclear ribonucleoprotein (snRNP)-like protein
MALFQQELTELLQTEVAVVVNDGMAFRGKLKKFDKDILVLQDVYETTNQEIDWVETGGGKGKPTTIKGYVPWRRVTIPQVIIRVPMILRVWPWAPADLDITPPPKRTTVKKPKVVKGKKKR